MAIKVRKGDKFVYMGGSQLLAGSEKLRADTLYTDAEFEIRKLERKRNLQGKQDALGIWHRRGVVINRLLQEHGVKPSEEKYFWLMLYTIMGGHIPEKARRLQKQNDFRASSILARYPLIKLRRIGTWGLWREVLGSGITGEDRRVAAWIANRILEDKIKTRDAARPLLKQVRSRLQNIDTNVLSDVELHGKLQEIFSK